MTEKQYLEIKIFSQKIMSSSFEPMHMFEHVERVRNNAMKIVKIMNLDKKLDLNVLQASCLLHDISYTKYRHNLLLYLFEGFVARRILSKILPQFKLSKKDSDTILNAVLKHPHSFPFSRLNKNGNLYEKILQDSDSMDLFSEGRLKSMIKAKDKSFSYKLANLISIPVWRYGRNNMKKYLNYPDVSEKIGVFRNG